MTVAVFSYLFTLAVLFAIYRRQSNRLFNLHIRGSSNVDTVTRNVTLFSYVDRCFILLVRIVNKDILVGCSFLARQFVHEPVKDSLLAPKDSIPQHVRQGHRSAVFILAGAFRRNLDRPVAAGNFDALIRFILSNINSGIKIGRTILPADSIGFCCFLSVLPCDRLGVLYVRYLFSCQNNFTARTIDNRKSSQIRISGNGIPALYVHQIREV